MRIFLLLLLAIFTVFLLVTINKKNRSVGVISGVLFSCLLYYCIVPIIFYSTPLKNPSGYVQYILRASSSDFIYAIICCLFFLVILGITYRAHRYNRSFLYKIDDLKLSRLSKKLCYICAIIGGISFILYIRAFGGVVRMLAYSEYMRSFSTSGESVLTHFQTILYIPSRLVTVVPFLSLMGFNKKNLFSVSLFLVFFSLGFLFFLYDAGKIGIIIYLLSLFVPILALKTQRPWFYVVILGMASLPIIGFLDSLFHYVSMGEWESYSDNSVLSYLQQFSYPFSNTLNLEGIASVSGYRYGRDFITGVLNIIPGVNFDVSYEPTSYFYGGSTWGESGGTPNDAVTFGYLQFGIIGVLFLGYLFGLITARIDNALVRLDNTFKNNVLKASLILLFFIITVNADVVGVVRNQFTLTILSLLVIISSKRYRVTQN